MQFFKLYLRVDELELFDRVIKAMSNRVNLIKRWKMCRKKVHDKLEFLLKNYFFF